MRCTCRRAEISCFFSIPISLTRWLLITNSAEKFSYFKRPTNKSSIIRPNSIKEYVMINFIRKEQNWGWPGYFEDILALRTVYSLHTKDTKFLRLIRRQVQYELWWIGQSRSSSANKLTHFELLYNRASNGGWSTTWKYRTSNNLWLCQRISQCFKFKHSSCWTECI